MSKNVSDQLMETLVEAGIQRIYAVTGDSLNHVNAAVHRNGKIKWMLDSYAGLLLNKKINIEK